MKFACDQCNAQYMIADEKIGERGVKVKCKKCSHIIVVKLPAAAPAEIPAPLIAGADTAGAGFPAAASSPPSDTGAAAGVGGAWPPPDAAAPSATGESSWGAAPAPAAGGAGSSFGLGNDVDFGDAWGGGAAAAAAASTPAADSRPRGEKEWYVAIDDSQVGPIDIGDIQEKWDAEEVDEDTLVWKAGMGDWSPIAEIPELAYLITERPQAGRQRPAAASAGVMASAGMGASMGAAASIATGPATFGGGAESDGEETSWQPSAASALSSLVEEELQASESKPEPQEPAQTAASLGMPSFGAGDLFGGGNGGAAMPSLGGGMGGGAPDPFAGGGAPAWSVPAARPSSGGLRAIHLVIGGMALLIVALIGGGAFFFMNKQAGGPAAPSPAVAQAPQTAAPAPGTTTQAPAEPAAKPEKPAAAPESKSRTTEPHRTPTTKPTPPSKPTKPRSNGGIDDVFDAPAKPKGPPPKAKLTVQDIVGTVKSQGRNLSACIKQARSSGEIVGGAYTFKLNWNIRPDGSVTNAQLTGPANVLNTSLPGCFAAQMRKWEFPPSQGGAPVANFPIPVKVP